MVLQGQIERSSYMHRFMSHTSPDTVAGAADADPAKELLGAVDAVKQSTSAAASQVNTTTRYTSCRNATLASHQLSSN
jgi:hypothetical protein